MTTRESANIKINASNKIESQNEVTAWCPVLALNPEGNKQKHFSWYKKMANTFGKFMVKGTVAIARPLITFFIVAAIGLPSIPSCMLYWENESSQNLRLFV